MLRVFPSKSVPTNKTMIVLFIVGFHVMMSDDFLCFFWRGAYINHIVQSIVVVVVVVVVVEEVVKVTVVEAIVIFRAQSTCTENARQKTVIYIPKIKYHLSFKWGMLNQRRIHNYGSSDNLLTLYSINNKTCSCPNITLCR